MMNRFLPASGPGVALILALATSACTSNPSTPHKFVWRQLSRGITSGLTEPRHLVIRDEATYFKHWAEHAASLNQPALPPAVDFSREMVILVAQGVRPTGGYLIEVVGIELRRRTLVVSVGERAPQPGQWQIQRLTQPYQFVALPAVTAPVRFRTVQEAQPPRRPRETQ